MDSGMLIMTAILGVVTVGIAAVTMDSADPQAPRNNYKARFAEQYGTDVPGMTEVDQVKWAREQDERRKQLLIRRQSMGPGFEAADFKRQEVIRDMAAQVNASRGVKPNGERYTEDEDRALRDRLELAMNANAAYEEPAIKKAVLQSQVSKIDHRLAYAKDATLDPAERRAQMELAKKWQKDYGVEHDTLAEADKALTEEERLAKTAADRQAFIAALAAIPDDPNDANFDALTAMKTTNPPGYDDDKLEAKYKTLLDIAYANIEKQLALGDDDPAVDDDLASDMYTNYNKRNLFPAHLKVNNDAKLKVKLQKDIETVLATGWSNELVVASRIALLDDIDAGLKRRPTPRAHIHAKDLYINYKKQVIVLKAILSLFVAYPTQNHLKIVSACTADYMKAAHGVDAFDFGADVDAKIAEVRTTIIPAAVRAIAALPADEKMEGLRVLLLRTRGRLVDMAAAKAPVLSAPSSILAEWGVIIGLYDKKTKTFEDAELVQNLFLQFRCKLTRYWGDPTEFVRYAEVSASVHERLEAALGEIPESDPVTRAEMIAKFAVVSSSYVKEVPEMNGPIDDFTEGVGAAWNPDMAAREMEVFLKTQVFPQLQDIEDVAPTFEARKVLLLRNLFPEWAGLTTEDQRRAFAMTKQLPELVEFPEVYFPELAVPVALARDMRAAIDGGRAADALTRYDRAFGGAGVPGLPEPFLTAAKAHFSAKIVQDVERLRHLKSLIVAINDVRGRDPAIPEFYIEKKIELYSLYITRARDWGLRVADNFGLLPAVDLTDATDALRAIITALPAAATVDEKKACVAHVLNKVRWAHAMLPQPEFGALIATVRPAMDWAAVQAAADDHIDDGFSARETAFIAFAESSTQYWPNADADFLGFTALLKKTSERRDELISEAERAADYAKLNAVIAGSFFPIYSDSKVDACIEDLNTGYDDVFESEDFKLLDFGRYVTLTPDFDIQVYARLENFYQTWEADNTTPDAIASAAKAAFVMRYPADLFA
jgi:hypothetical protein